MDEDYILFRTLVIAAVSVGDKLMDKEIKSKLYENVLKMLNDGLVDSFKEDKQMFQEIWLWKFRK